MENKENNDFKALSEMLTRNKGEKKNGSSDDKSVDEILNSVGKDEPKPEVSDVLGAKAEQENVGYNPAGEIAGANAPEDDDATRVVAPSAPKPVTVKKPRSTSAERTAKERRRREARIKADRQRQHRRTFGHIFGGVVLSLCIIVVSIYLGIFILNAALDYTGIATTEFEIQIEIPENASTNEIAAILQKNGLITMPKLFEIYSSLSGSDGNYRSGSFQLSSAMSYSKLVDALQATGVTKTTVQVRIVEGMTAREIGDLLEENSVCRAEDFVQFYENKMDVYSFEKRVDVSTLKFYQLEGYLFPDTYEFYQVRELLDDPTAAVDTKSNAEAAAEKIYSNFNSKITKIMYKQMNEMGFTLDELITLASMVQSEAGTVDDMGNIASVFLNRLNNSDEYPYLQSDVTVFYIRDNIKPYYSEIKPSTSLATISDAYDTYVCRGIPAGPVCNPGMDAIKAVLNAPKTNYFYFCADPDTLETYYATTHEEHEANLAMIEENKAARTEG